METEVEASNPITVMLVEDHMVLRIGLKSVIENQPGFKIIAEADDGLQAVTLAQTTAPDVIIMDVSMPVLNGIEATRQIKALACKSKVLMLTSHDGDDQVFSALSAGADGYCLKDIPVLILCDAIRAVHAGVCWLDPAIAKKVILSCTATKKVSSRVVSNGEPAKFDLSARQMEILELLVHGMSNLQMAEHLSVSHDTIKTHMRNIMEKLKVADRTQVAVKAIRAGLIE